jgi:MtfA peptidase
MFSRWLNRGLQGIQAHREAAALQRRPIPDDLWKRTLIRYPFLQRRQPQHAADLRRLTRLFLDSKEFTTTGGLRLTDAMAVAIAAQAALPILRLGLARYSGFVGIVVQPDQALAQRELMDEHGVVHNYSEPLAGEAMQGGPVMLSWADVRAAGQLHTQGYNVVIHEFAHVLDMANGDANGVPALPDHLPLAVWQRTLSAAFDRLQRQSKSSKSSESGEPSALDAYGATAPEEFFAVASESFFVNPRALQIEEPQLYAVLAQLYAQDPAQDTPAAGERPALAKKNRTA